MSWQTISVAEIADLITKGTTPTTIGKDFTSEGVTFIKAEALNGNSSLDPKGFFFIDDQTQNILRRSRLCQDDVLITIAGANIGKCGFVKAQHLPANTNQAVGIIRINKRKAIPKFVYYFFKQKTTFGFIQGLNAQAAQPNINLVTLGNIKIPFPPLQIQHRIADIISAYDDLIENNRRRINSLEKSAHLLFKDWFVRLRFPGHDLVKVKDGIPEGWERKPLQDVGKLNYGKSLNSDDLIPGIFPVYGSSGIIGAHVKPFAKGPGIIVGRKGNVGSIYWSEGDFFPIDTVYFIDSHSSNLFLYHALLHTSLISTDGAVPGLNRSFAHSRKILLPKHNLFNMFNELVKPVFLQVANLKKYSESLGQARDLLLPRLMNGEIDV